MPLVIISGIDPDKLNAQMFSHHEYMMMSIFNFNLTGESLMEPMQVENQELINYRVALWSGVYEHSQNKNDPKAFARGVRKELEQIDKDDRCANS